MKDPGEHDELWELLGRAKKPEPSPFFARNVVRQVRATPPRGTLFSWFTQRVRVVSLASVAVLLLAMNILLPVLERHPAPESAPAQLMAKNEVKNDYEVINHLDELLAYEENSLWLENSK